MGSKGKLLIKRTELYLLGVRLSSLFNFAYHHSQLRGGSLEFPKINGISGVYGFLIIRTFIIWS